MIRSKRVQLLALLTALLLLVFGCGKKDVVSPAQSRDLGGGQYPVKLLYLHGSPYEIGYQHGQAAKDRIQKFVQNLHNVMQVMSIPQEFVDNAYTELEPFIPERYKEEMQGLAEGAGISIEDVHRLHAIPDLSEYHCTFFAAWGSATKDHQLLQIRALDYEMDAHFQEYPAILIIKPDEGVPHAVIGWTGFIGAVSGMNAQGIAVSEIGDNYGPEHETLAGEPMPFLLRDVLWDAKSLDEAVNMIKNAHRTSSFLYCVGDAKIPDARAFKTAKDFCEVYTDASLPQKPLKNVVYFSMGVGHEYNQRVYQFLKQRLGQLDVDAAKQLMHDVGTGNLHAVVYHPSTGDVWVANAGPAPNPEPAYNREYVHVNLPEELAKIKP